MAAALALGLRGVCLLGFTALWRIYQVLFVSPCRVSGETARRQVWTRDVTSIATGGGRRRVTNNTFLTRPAFFFFFLSFFLCFFRGLFDYSRYLRPLHAARKRLSS